MRIITRLSLFTVLTLSPALLVLADTPATPADVLSGKLFPLTLQLKDMTSGWSTFTCDSANSPSRLIGLAGYAPTDYAQMSMLDAIFTRGQTVVLGGETYLVAYGRSQAQFAKLLMNPEWGRQQVTIDPATLKFTPETEVTLQLLNMHTMGNIENIRQFNLKELSSTNTVLENARLKALKNTSLSQLRQIAIATQMYMQDNHGKLPPLDTLADFQGAVDAYLGNNQAMLVQPGTGTPYQPNFALAGKKRATSMIR